jgi:hypothetical protein
LRWHLQCKDVDGKLDLSFQLVGEVRYTVQQKDHGPKFGIKCGRVSRKTLLQWFPDKQYPPWMKEQIEESSITARLWETLDTRERQPRSAGEQPRPGLVMPVYKPSKLFADCAVHREMTLSRQADQDKRRSARVSEAYDES